MNSYRKCFRICGLLDRRYGLRHKRLHGRGWGSSWSVQVWYGKPGCPPTSERAYGTFLTTIDEETGFRLRKWDLFLFLPKRQKVRNTPNSPHIFVPLQTVNLSLQRCSRWGWTGIGTQVVGQRHPSVGPRRDGYASPAEYVCPFCSAIVEVIRDRSSDETCVEGFEWSLGFLTRTFG